MQAKKLTVALHLDPPASEADAAALDVLQQWYAQTKRNYGDGSDMDGAVRQFHHDVYLSGLQIHLISSQLCRGIATSLKDKSTATEVLLRQLEASGLWHPQPSSSPADPDAAFTAAQLEQMAQVVAQAQSSADTESDEGATGNEAAALAELGANQSAMLDELKHLRSLAEQQAAELSRLRHSIQPASASESSRSSDTEELDVAEMAPQLAQMQKIREKGVF